YGLREINTHYELIGSRRFTIEHGRKLNYFDAAKECEVMGGHLATIRNENELKAINAKLRHAQFYWIDLNDLDNFGEYVVSATGKRGTFFHWDEGEPNHLRQNEHCVELAWGHMNDRVCADVNNFIC
ncbi:hypothetical protein KR018_003825, partial [Drosophila ironensis]